MAQVEGLLAVQLAGEEHQAELPLAEDELRGLAGDTHARDPPGAVVQHREPRLLQLGHLGADAAQVVPIGHQHHIVLLGQLIRPAPSAARLAALTGAEAKG